MPARKLIWDMIPEEKKKESIGKIVEFARSSWDESVGIVAAEQLYDMVMESTFAAIYNLGVADAQKIIEQKMADINVDLDSLIKGR